MKKLKATTLYAFLCLFLVTNIAFATDDDDEEPESGAGIGIEEECGFFCSIGEFFEDLLGDDEDPC
ncbi:hypothetical protein [uncultured Dokdonia sp.]|uniref:hypothetical protein n=1 Tax=uncultured Dokdonia sp. TaxID=575653 RepID=UPI00260DE257|nr:hypothetical protein [uncultured Dokdonia sp.]